MTQPTLFVCESCRFSAEETERDGLRGGAYLLQNLRSHLQNHSIAVNIQPAPCLAACGKSCAIGFAAPGKCSYVFGSLPPLTPVDDIVQFMHQYTAAIDGRVPYRERPELLKKGIIAALPAISLTSSESSIKH